MNLTQISGEISKRKHPHIPKAHSPTPKHPGHDYTNLTIPPYKQGSPWVFKTADLIMLRVLETSPLPTARYISSVP